MRRALAIDEKSFGPDHPNVAIRLNNLAQLLQDTDRLDEAEPLMRRALAIDEKSFGPDHPDVAIRPQQPRPIAASHQPARRSRAADAPRMLRSLWNSRAGRGIAIRIWTTAFANYAGLLAAMGKSKAEIDAACAELRRPLER